MKHPFKNLELIVWEKLLNQVENIDYQLLKN